MCTKWLSFHNEMIDKVYKAWVGEKGQIEKICLSYFIIKTL